MALLQGHPLITDFLMVDILSQDYDMHPYTCQDDSTFCPRFLLFLFSIAASSLPKQERIVGIQYATLTSEVGLRS